MKKIILLTLVLTTGVPISCINTSKGSSTFIIEKLGISVGNFQDGSSFHSFQEISFDPAPTDTLSATDLAIQVHIEETSIVAATGSTWFVPSVFADQVLPRSESKLSVISIYSEESIFADGKEFQAGDNLNNLFLISAHYNFGQTSILQFLEQFDTWYFDDQLYLTLNADLDQPLAQSLKMDFTFENGKVIEMNTKKIVVK